MTRSDRWKYYCKTSFHSLNSVTHLWGDPNYFRPITRIYYDAVFSCGTPNHTGMISENAFNNKQVGGKTVHDHYLSPQFIGRMIMDCPDEYLSDYDRYKEIFWKSCGTIIVTAKENDDLSLLTDNRGSDYKVTVPTDKKYKHLGINLYHRPESVGNKWKNVNLDKADENDLYFPDQLLEYEKNYLVS